MSDDSDDDLIAIDPEDLPPLDTAEGRMDWAGILLQQDERTVERNGLGWIKALVVAEGSDMVARFIYDDGTEEVYDLEIRRKLAAVSYDEAEQN